MKPEISNQDWSEARHTAILINPDMLPGNIRTIAQAIAVAHQRGRREGMEEAAKVADSYANDAGDKAARGYFTETERASRSTGRSVAAAIRAKMEEQP